MADAGGGAAFGRSLRPGLAAVPAVRHHQALAGARGRAQSSRRARRDGGRHRRRRLRRRRALRAAHDRESALWPMIRCVPSPRRCSAPAASRGCASPRRSPAPAAWWPPRSPTSPAPPTSSSAAWSPTPTPRRATSWRCRPNSSPPMARSAARSRRRWRRAPSPARRSISPSPSPASPAPAAAPRQSRSASSGSASPPRTARSRPKATSLPATARRCGTRRRGGRSNCCSPPRRHAETDDHRRLGMSEANLTVRDIKVRAVNAPLKRPVRTAVGAIPTAPLVLIDVATDQGVVGRAYLFAYTLAALAPLARLVEEIGVELKGKPVVPVERQRDFDRRFRLLGWQGLVGMAVSGLDMALWDALGQAAGWPVARLLGGAPVALPAYDSYGIVDPREDERALTQSVASGFRAIKIKLGDGDVARDVATVKAVRALIGPGIALMVDYNQSLDPVEAGRRIAAIAAYDIHWVEEPVRAEDLQGHARVRAASPVRVQTGENWWFPRAMADAIAAAAIDEAASLPMSSHIFVEASAHLLAVTPTAHWLEYLDVAGAILAEPCQLAEGRVTARGPGLGLAWDEKAVERFKL